MLKSRKHVFWEALFVTVVIFMMGLLIGVWVESGRVDKVNEYFVQSELSLIDALASNNLWSLDKLSCDEIMELNSDFANRIYDEAKELEKFEASEKLTEGLKVTHRRYDLLRTLLWINTFRMDESCERNVHVVVYLYEFETVDLAKKATQNVWSKVLFDLKEKRGAEILLIPIAADSGSASLNSLLKGYDIEEYPVVIIDNDKVVSELTSVEELEKYLEG